ncbi:MAG: DUF1592 domain-containing protein [Bryobacterales bacterium]|nr:DUF1592 domain-containing protein [Bryobacterales bacterium]
MKLLLPVLLLSVLAHAQDFSPLYRAFEAAQCRLCHNDNGVASATRIHFPPDQPSKEAVDAFGLRLSRLVDRDRPGQSLLLLKPMNRVQHTGGARIHPGSPEEKLLRGWVDYLASLSPEKLASASGVRRRTPGSRGVRRLTHSQYNHTVRDLLGDQTSIANQFPKEDYSNGFTNQAEAQGIPPLLAEAYSRAAAKLARNAFLGGDRNKLVPCDPAAKGCRARFVAEFGRRAFRRPLTKDEVARYENLFSIEADFLKGAQLAMEAMLQSPNFLFHAERPDGGRDSFQTASRLSYFFWDTMPDETLFQAAAKGELNTDAGIERISRGMLADPRARLAMDEFLAQWLRFDRLRSAVRDRRVYPEFTDELVSAMTEETRRFFQHLVWNDGDFREFFTAGYGFPNSSLAQVYGMPAPKEEFAMVHYPENSPRSGVLGQATFLSVTGKPSDSSPTERGIFVREHFLCQVMPPPPPGVSATLPPETDEKPMTNRERLAAHLTDKSCASCHGLVDAVGFGFEHFDAAGKFREKQVVTIYPTFDETKQKRKTKPTEYQLPIDSSAFVRGIANSEFSSPKGLGRILASDPGCQKCVVKQLFRYATGRLEVMDDQPEIDAALEEFRRSQFRFRNLIIAIAASKAFLGGQN